MNGSKLFEIPEFSGRRSPNAANLPKTPFMKAGWRAWNPTWFLRWTHLQAVCSYRGVQMLLQYSKYACHSAWTRECVRPTGRSGSNVSHRPLGLPGRRLPLLPFIMECCSRMSRDDKIPTPTNQWIIFRSCVEDRGGLVLLRENIRCTFGKGCSRASVLLWNQGQHAR